MYLIDFARRPASLYWKACIILLMFGATASAQTGPRSRWALHVYDNAGDRYIDQPCSPLEKFRGDPKPFDSEHWSATLAIIDDKVELEQVGKVSGFSVYSLTHNVEMNKQGESSDELNVVIKMILVERKSGEFCEIFQQEYPLEGVLAKPAYFIDAGETVLATKDAMSGSGGFRIEAYWTFDKVGPVPLDLIPVKKMAENLLPPGYSFFSIPYFFGPVEDGGKVLWLNFRDIACTHWNGNHPDDSCSWVSLNFRVKDHKLIATSKMFAPPPQ